MANFRNTSAGRGQNKYLASLARQSKTPSLSDFKFAVYGLRYCYRLLGLSDKSVQLPSIKHDNKLPVVLNYQECKALFKAPELLKHRVLLSLMYSAGLRAREASRLRIADIDSGRMMVHIRQSKYNKDWYVPLSPLILYGLRKYYYACRPWVSIPLEKHGWKAVNRTCCRYLTSMWFLLFLIGLTACFFNMRLFSTIYSLPVHRKQ